MNHNLKILPEYFQAIIESRKTFELRRNDRNFQVGDTLTLYEIKAEDDQPTHRSCVVEVLYILDRYDMALINNYCIMAIKLISSLTIKRN